MKPLPLLSLSGALPSRSQALDGMNLRSSSFRSHKLDGMKPSATLRRPTALGARSLPPTLSYAQPSILHRLRKEFFNFGFSLFVVAFYVDLRERYAEGFNLILDSIMIVVTC
ncbi:hypothetical protein KFK09_008648 [Dendrobium nobile]|uniref:Uncharacterized protein n=1 Tax=Dendrobium nobile TaxID=94219 RepID=A0A8T3BLP7_DENNO|nr:hypothetical protein KFK09_008648 [Dendrobium nobile]